MGTVVFAPRRPITLQLTLYTDYALRTLIYLGVHPEGGTISDVAASYAISRNHLVKVVHNLGRLGYIHTVRGKSGGLSLARPPERIGIGDVVRDMENSFELVECFNARANECPISGACRLERALHEANRAFMRVLDAYTLKDVLANPNELLHRLSRNRKPKRSGKPAKAS